VFKVLLDPRVAQQVFRVKLVFKVLQDLWADLKGLLVFKDQQVSREVLVPRDKPDFKD
jgi:hypothetical protein